MARYLPPIVSISWDNRDGPRSAGNTHAGLTTARSLEWSDGNGYQ